MELGDDGASSGLGRKARLVFAATQWIGWLRTRGRREASGRTILVARRGRLGDTIAILPMLEALREHLPGSRIVLGVDAQSPARALLAESKLVDAIRVLEVDPRASRWAVLAVLWRLLAERFDALIVGEEFSHLDLAFLCGAPLRIGLDDGAPRTALCNHRIALDPTRPAADNHVALLAALGAPLRRSRAPRLPAPAAPARGADPLAPLGGAPFVVLHPGSQKPSRRWPVERFAELADRLLRARPDLHLTLTGVIGEAALGAHVVAKLDPALRERCLPLAGATDLPQLFWILSRARLVICNDTGVMHVARALGAPLLALLGAENDRYWGPHPDGFGPAIALGRTAPCTPCARWDCEPHFCMRSLDVDAAFDAASRLLDREAGGPLCDFLERNVRAMSWERLAREGHPLPHIGRAPAAPGVLSHLALLRMATLPGELPGRYPGVVAPASPATPASTALGALLAQVPDELILIDTALAGGFAGDPSGAVAQLIRNPALDAVALGESGSVLARRSSLESVVNGDRVPHSALHEPEREGWTAALAALAREVWSARDLLTQITQRDIRVRYKQAVMGFAWAILTPALVLAAGILVRSAMAHIGGTSLAAPVLAGMAVKALPWAFFVSAIGFATSSLTGNLELITKVAFPRIVLPVSATLAAAFDTTIGAIGTALLLLALGLKPTAALAWVPLLAALAILLTTASAIFLSCANLFFRDVKYIVQLLLTFGIFFTPVLFEPQMLGDVGGRLLMLNPLSPVLEGLRLCVAYGHDLAQPFSELDASGHAVQVWSPWYLAYSAAVATVWFAASAVWFRRLEHLFAEYV